MIDVFDLISRQLCARCTQVTFQRGRFDAYRSMCCQPHQCRPLHATAMIRDGSQPKKSRKRGKKRFLLIGKKVSTAKLAVGYGFVGLCGTGAKNIGLVFGRGGAAEINTTAQERSRWTFAIESFANTTACVNFVRRAHIAQPTHRCARLHTSTPFWRTVLSCCILACAFQCSACTCMHAGGQPERS